MLEAIDWLVKRTAWRLKSCYRMYVHSGHSRVPRWEPLFIRICMWFLAKCSLGILNNSVHQNGPERGIGSLATLLYALHKDYVGAESKSFRICRQLLSLGFFRQPDLSVNVDPPDFNGLGVVYTMVSTLLNFRVRSVAMVIWSPALKSAPLWRRSSASSSAARSLYCSSRLLRSGIWSECATSSAASTRWSSSYRLSVFNMLREQMRCSPNCRLLPDTVLHVNLCERFHESCSACEV